MVGPVLEFRPAARQAATVHQLTTLWSGVRDLLLPVTCAGCRREATGLICGDCVAALARLTPRPVRPDPPPPGLPRCHAAGPYRGRLRELILAYKDRGRHALARPLGDVFARVLAAVPAHGPLLLIPVPTTARAVRERRGDHMLRLAHAAARRLRGQGRRVALASPVRARPRPDSAGLSAVERVRLARASLVPRRFPGTDHIRRQLRRISARGSEPPAVVVLDDVITTGATANAVCAVLAGIGLPVDAVAVLAATERRQQPSADRTW